MLQAENYVYKRNAEALEEELDKQRALPPGWAAMDAEFNTQLFEVDAAHAEVSGLVKALQDTGAQVVKVCALLLP